MSLEENENPGLPPVDKGNPDIFTGAYGDVHISRGTVQRVDGKVMFHLTFRQGLATFSIPFPDPASLRALGQLCIDDADALDENIPKPSGLYVPGNQGGLIR